MRLASSAVRANGLVHSTGLPAAAPVQVHRVELADQAGPEHGDTMGAGHLSSQILAMVLRTAAALPSPSASVAGAAWWRSLRPDASQCQVRWSQAGSRRSAAAVLVEKDNSLDR